MEHNVPRWETLPTQDFQRTIRKPLPAPAQPNRLSCPHVANL